VNRQGNDFGTSYRSASSISTTSSAHIAEDTIADVEASGLGGAGRDRGDAGGAVWEAEPEQQTTSSTPNGYTCHFARLAGCAA